MKEKYVRVFPESGDENFFSCASGLILFVWTLFATVAGLGTILFIIILETSMASFTADDHAVTFRYLLKKQ